MRWGVLQSETSSHSSLHTLQPPLKISASAEVADRRPLLIHGATCSGRGYNTKGTQTSDIPCRHQHAPTNHTHPIYPLPTRLCYRPAHPEPREEYAAPSSGSRVRRRVRGRRLLQLESSEWRRTSSSSGFQRGTNVPSRQSSVHCDSAKPTHLASPTDDPLIFNRTVKDTEAETFTRQAGDTVKKTLGAVKDTMEHLVGADAHEPARVKEYDDPRVCSLSSSPCVPMLKSRVEPNAGPYGNLGHGSPRPHRQRP